MFDLPPADEVLGAMITPAVLISACSTLALSTSNRLGRVVDRVRKLAQAAEDLPDEADADGADHDKRELVADQLEVMAARVRLLQAALTGIYAALGLLVAASLAIGLTALVRWRFGWVPVALGLVGAAALFGASAVLVREARLAVRATLAETTYALRVVSRKTGRALA